MLGNYPKPTMHESDNTPIGLPGMLALHRSGDGSLLNPSIDTSGVVISSVKKNGQRIFEESTAVGAKILNEYAICIDVMPFQLAYDANIKRILEIMESEYKAVWDLYVRFTDRVFGFISISLTSTGQDPIDTPILTLGSLPFELMKPRRILHGPTKDFGRSLRTPHPCSIIGVTHACGKKRLLEGDRSYIAVVQHIYGSDAYVEFHQ